MGHNNYSKFFKNTESEEVNPVMEEQISIEEIVNEEVMKIEDSVEETIVEVETVVGVVSGCEKLNLRAEANKDSKILTILDKNTELIVDIDASTTEDFYKVITNAGVEGYCMKKFITIK